MSPDEPMMYRTREMADHLRRLDEPKGLYFDKDGRPIGMLTAAKLRDDPNYCRIGNDILAFPTGHVRVSTVWTAIDHGFGRTRAPMVRKTMVFETMVFGGRRWDHWQMRWRTGEQAQKGHALFVEAVRLDWRRSKLDMAVTLLAYDDRTR